MIDELQTGRYRHARVNYANGDMVGHTGHRVAAIQSVEAVDLQLARLLPVIESLGGALIVTADHGNADCMFEIDKKTGEPAVDSAGHVKVKTSHTLNPVPLHIFRARDRCHARDARCRRREAGTRQSREHGAVADGVRRARAFRKDPRRVLLTGLD